MSYINYSHTNSIPYNKSNNYTYRHLQKKLIFFICILFLACIILMGKGISTFASSQHSIDQFHKYYKSIEIQTGDTLWDIADEYTSNIDIRTKDYVEEVYFLNGLTDGKLHQGQHLVVPYYVAN